MDKAGWLYRDRHKCGNPRPDQTYEKVNDYDSILQNQWRRSLLSGFPGVMMLKTLAWLRDVQGLRDPGKIPRIPVIPKPNAGSAPLAQGEGSLYTGERCEVARQ